MILGKLIGAFFGFLLAKHIGLLLGVLIGHWFDKGLRANLHPFGLNPEARAAIQAVFFELTFSVLGYIAKADGRVNESEIQMAQSLMQEFRLNAHQRQQAMDHFRQGKTEAFDLRAALIKLQQHCARYPHLLQLFLEIQVQAAYADGVCHPSEQRVLEMICDVLQIPRFVLAQCQARVQAERAFRAYYDTGDPRRWHERQSSSRGYTHTRSPYQGDPLKEAYGVLGISPTASTSEIKKAYRKLMSAHHPDKLISQGLPESMLKMATEKTQEIQKAYDLIIKARG